MVTDGLGKVEGLQEMRMAEGRGIWEAGLPPGQILFCARSFSRPLGYSGKYATGTWNGALLEFTFSLGKQMMSKGINKLKKKILADGDKQYSRNDEGHLEELLRGRSAEEMVGRGSSWNSPLGLGQDCCWALRTWGPTGAYCLPGLHGGAGGAAGWTASLHAGADAASAGAGDAIGQHHSAPGPAAGRGEDLPQDEHRGAAGGAGRELTPLEGVSPQPRPPSSPFVLST